MILVAHSLGRTCPVLHRLVEEGVLFVAAGLSSPDALEDAALPCVDTDNLRGASEAVRHLLGLGHRRIGHGQPGDDELQPCTTAWWATGARWRRRA